MNALKNNRTIRMLSSIVMSLGMATGQVSLASDAQTNASATGNVWGSGTATAGARYTGDQGYARTDTRSGNVNFASGVAWGFDSRGVSFSASNALAGRLGPAFASNFNISIGLDGSVATSGGLSSATGGLTRTVSAGGFARDSWRGSVAGSTAGARSEPNGISTARTWSHTIPRTLWSR